MVSTRASDNATSSSAARRQQQRGERSRDDRGGHNDRKPRNKDSPEARLSKLLSFALGPGAAEHRFDTLDTGYVALPEMLAHSTFRAHTLEQIEAVVRNCSDQRFSIVAIPHGKYIRDNRAHRRARSQNTERLEPLVTPDAIDWCVHNTFIKYWSSMYGKVLYRMTRDHIHCTTDIVPWDYVPSTLMDK